MYCVPVSLPGNSVPRRLQQGPQALDLLSGVADMMEGAGLVWHRTGRNPGGSWQDS